MTNYQKAIDFVLRHEGKRFIESSGHVSIHGINARFWPAEVAAMEQMEEGPRREYAEKFYKEKYWLPDWDSLPQELATAALDTAVNMGFIRAQRMLKMSENNLLVFLALRLEAYTNIQEWEKYGRGWVRRVADLMKEGT